MTKELKAVYNASNAAELDALDHVRFTKIKPRTYRYSSSTARERSLIEVRVDDALVGYLSMPNGWGRVYHIETVEGTRLRNVYIASADKPWMDPHNYAKAVELVRAGVLRTAEGFTAAKVANEEAAAKAEAERAERKRIRDEERERHTVVLAELLMRDLTEAERAAIRYAVGKLDAERTRHPILAPAGTNKEDTLMR